MKTKCPKCGVGISYTEKHEGKKVQCPKCKQPFLLPASATPVVELPEPTNEPMNDLLGEIDMQAAESSAAPLAPIPKRMRASQSNAASKGWTTVCLISACFVGLSVLLPWLSVRGGHRSGIDEGSTIILGAAMVVVLLLVGAYFNGLCQSIAGIAAAVFGVIAALYLFGYALTVWNMPTVPFRHVRLSLGIHVGIGVYLGILSSLICSACAVPIYLSGQLKPLIGLAVHAVGLVVGIAVCICTAQNGFPMKRPLIFIGYQEMAPSTEDVPGLLSSERSKLAAIDSQSDRYSIHELPTAPLFKQG